MQWDLGFESKKCMCAQEKKTQERTEIFVVVAGSQGEGITTDLDWGLGLEFSEGF